MDYQKKKARTEHICSNCGKTIKSGEEYYCEITFLASLHRKLEKLCVDCFEKRG